MNIEGIETVVDDPPQDDPPQDEEPQDEEPQDDPPAQTRFDEVVDEVIRGQWGQGQARRLRLANAGFDHRAVQEAVVERANS